LLRFKYFKDLLIFIQFAKLFIIVPFKSFQPIFRNFTIYDCFIALNNFDAPDHVILF